LTRFLAEAPKTGDFDATNPHRHSPHGPLYRLQLDALKSRVDLPALIRSRGVELKTHGDGHLIGKCPFHADDTPSFVVTPGKGLFHCLGCGAAGNVFQFVMKADGISFRHAVELLRGDPVKLLSPIGDGNLWRVLSCPLDAEADDAALLRQVVDYYHERLFVSPDALAYLQKRGLGDPELIKRYRIG
jgi:DNA primase